MPSRDKESYSIHAVENALDVLEALSEGEDEVRISQLSEKLAMNKTSVFRLLATFESRGYVERDTESGKYRLGLTAYETAQKFLSKMVLLRHARPVMDKLARQCNESVYLTLRHNHDVLFLDKVDVPQQVKIASLSGKRFPLETTAAGQVLMAFNGGTAEASEPLDIADHALSTAQILTIQKQGYSCGGEALGEGIVSIAAPLLGTGGVLHGALCLVGPAYRLSDNILHEQIGPNLLEACRIISSKLGWHTLTPPHSRL